MRFLICTDVAARGIDIRGIPFVVNVTLPDEKQNYVHRIGRVGRADRMGLAISLVSKVKEKVSKLWGSKVILCILSLCVASHRALELHSSKEKTCVVYPDNSLPCTVSGDKSLPTVYLRHEMSYSQAQLAVAVVEA